MLKVFLRCLLISFLFTTTALSVFAQDEVVFVPFGDETFGIQGVVPEGWQNENEMGFYQRQNSASDVTMLIIQSAPLSIDDLWPRLLPQFALDAVPEITGMYSSDSFDWTLYHFTFTQGALTVDFDMGMTEQEGSTYLVILQAMPDEAEALYDSVFVPVMESISPLQAADVPYLVEEVTFDNGDITLAGTLTLPEKDGQHPAVVLMSGSGPQNRDSIAVSGFPMFKQIADHLTRNGIAVLRYDDRGVGQSEGDYNAASIYDFAADATSAIAYLKTRPDINPDQVGVIGHSEGSVYAAIIGGDPDSGAAFVVSLAGLGVDGQSVLLHQNDLILRAEGAADDQVETQIDFLKRLFPSVAERDWDAVAELVRQQAITEWEALTEAEQAATGAGDVETYAKQGVDNFLQNYANESFASLMEYDPHDDWAKTTIPVLAIFGSVDVQADDAQNAAPMEAALTEGGNEDFTVLTLEGANHLFQAAETGAISEYSSLPKIFTPELLPTITDWLLARVDVA